MAHENWFGIQLLKRDRQRIAAPLIRCRSRKSIFNQSYVKPPIKTSKMSLRPQLGRVTEAGATKSRSSLAFLSRGVRPGLVLPELGKDRVMLLLFMSFLPMVMKLLIPSCLRAPHLRTLLKPSLIKNTYRSICILTFLNRLISWMLT